MAATTSKFTDKTAPHAFPESLPGFCNPWEAFSCPVRKRNFPLMTAIKFVYSIIKGPGMKLFCPLDFILHCINE
jgi:hypothetical protein